MPSDALPVACALTYTLNGGGINNIWRLPIDGSASTRIVHFDSDQHGYGYAWTADGTRLFFMRQEPATR